MTAVSFKIASILRKNTILCAGTSEELSTFGQKDEGLINSSKCTKVHGISTFLVRVTITFRLIITFPFSTLIN